ncbi:MAG: flagellar biosynthetic protein FliO [Acidobacteriota bacterium]
MEILRQLVAVAAVFAALAGAVWALKRGRGGGWPALGRKRAGRLEALERVALTPQHTLHLVRCGERTLLVAAHQGGCTLLDAGGSRPAGAPLEAAR